MIHTFTTREAWLALRKTVVTSTQVPALFGMSPYLTALELALLKRGDITDDFEETERTRWGLRLQESIALGVGDDYGVNTIPETGFGICDDCQLGASFDFRIVAVNNRKIDDERLRLAFGKHGDGLMEIKNVDRLIFRDWPENEAPAQYELQLQTEMVCADVQWGALCVMVGGNTAHVFTRERDIEVERAIRSKVNQFWADLSIGKLPPANMPEDADTLRRLYNYAEPGSLLDAQSDEEIGQLCAEYSKASAEMKTADDNRNVARARLLEKIGDHEKVIANGYSISAGMIGPCDVSFTREGYRNFKVYKRKEVNKK